MKKVSRVSVANRGNIDCKSTMVENPGSIPGTKARVEVSQRSRASSVRNRAGKAGRGQTTQGLVTTKDYVFIIRAMGNHWNVTHGFEKIFQLRHGEQTGGRGSDVGR